MLPNIRRAILFVLLAASPAAAQSLQPVEHQWSRGTTLGLVGGVGTASDGTGAALGGSLGWELTPQVGLDATATWLDRQTGASGFSAALSVHAGLPTLPRLAPYVEGGFGMYIANFDSKETSNIPPFYADRMSALSQTFVDPAFVAGAGFNVFRGRRVAVRPSFGALIAFTGGNAYTVGTFTVRVEYHFELPATHGSRK
jgi:Outer membrane protein beta-barrel domain